MPHYFSLGDSMIPGRQKISGKTPQQTRLQPCSSVTRWAHFTQGTIEMVWCLKAQTGASDKHNPRKTWVGGTPWSTAWSLLRPAAPHAVNGCHFTLAFRLTLEKREAEHHLRPCLAHLYSWRGLPSSPNPKYHVGWVLLREGDLFFCSAEQNQGTN